MCGRRTSPRHATCSGCTAQRPRVRALCAAIPSRSPLLPALARSLRAASVFLTSPPHRARGRGQEHYGSTSRVTRQEGVSIRERTGGETRNPPGPEKPRPGSRFSPRPPFLPPRHDRTRRANDRGNCTGRRAYSAAPFDRWKLQTPGEPETPQSPVSRFPRTPSRLPPPEGALRGHGRLAYHADPGTDGNQHTTAPTPQPPHRPADAEQTHQARLARSLPPQPSVPPGQHTRQPTRTL
jgi:hypothetical protein